MDCDIVRISFRALSGKLAEFSAYISEFLVETAALVARLVIIERTFARGGWISVVALNFLRRCENPPPLGIKVRIAPLSLTIL